MTWWLGSSTAFAQDIAPTTALEHASIDTQLLAFVEGMIAEVDAHHGDCAAVADAMRTYCQTRRAWIASLNYVSGNLDEKTVNAIHEKAVTLGEKLAACFDARSAAVIPEILKMCAE